MREKCKLSVQYIISKLSWDMQKFSFHFSDTLWLVQKLSHHELACPGRIQKFGEFLLLFFMEDFEMFDEMILRIIFFLFFLLLHYWKIKKSLQWGVTQKYTLSCLWQVLLFFQHQTLWKNNKALQNTYWTCLNIQLNQRFWICSLFLHV